MFDSTIKFHRCIAASSLFWIIIVAHAADSCEPVLQKAGRNYSNDQYYNSVASKIYDQACSGSVQKSGASGGMDVGGLISGLPLRFGASGSNQSEMVSNFCKTYDSLIKSDSSIIKINSAVVDNTVNAWLACKRLSSEGVDFETSIQLTQFSVTAIRTRPDPLIITGVKYDKELASCTVPEVSGITGAKAGAADMNTRIALSGGSVARLTVTCSRIPIISADGTRQYPGVDFQLITSKGVFGLPVEAETTLPLAQASAIEKRISSLERVAQDADTRLTKIARGVHTKGCFHTEWTTKYQTDPDYSTIRCNTEAKMGYYVSAIDFIHVKGEDLAYQERVRAYCCPLSGT